jgi:triphosphatase
MEKEVELKLELTPDALRQLQESAWLRALPQPAKVQTLVSVYFDTRKHVLRKRNMSLRVRHDEGQKIQTAKTLAAGLIRAEEETKIEGDEPKLTRRRANLLGVKPRKLRSKLVPIFETRVERRSLPIEVEGALVELAIDEGEIRVDGRTEPICEVELELKRGEPERLVRVAKRLMAEVPVRYAARSKAERGYALCDGRAFEAAHPEPIELLPDASVGDAFRVSGLSSLRQITLNEEGVRARDAEAVHEMRVGLRRLRAAMSTFKQLLGDSESERIKAGVKWLTEELGPARDIDVLVNETPALEHETQHHAAEIGQLAAVLEGRRAASFNRAAKAIQSERYRTLVLDTALWLTGGAWATVNDELVRIHRDGSARRFARRALDERAGAHGHGPTASP